ncbi:MAG: hypothetical protein PWQ57_1499 [Desulfovibrionales bacterium]|jgi:zinc transporter ZupT|nr:hypothetical protein [Desulfovibrionales bacterium]
MNQNKETDLEKTLDALAKGILAGGALGAVAGWFFMDFSRALLLGLVCGFLAGATHRLHQKRKEQ